MSLNAALSIQNLVVQVDKTTLLDIPSLHIEPGERVAIVGHNGAGKSTLLRCLSGFVTPTHGELHVLGRNLGTPLNPVELRRLRTDIGQVMQGLHLVLRLSSLDNVLMGLLGRRSGWRTWLRVPAPGDIQAAKAALAAVGMLAKADARADTLSGGERQKVAIARMLVQGPSLILADEPTASLDPLAAAEVCSLLAHAAKGATLISVVHSPSLLPILARRVIGLKQGRLEFDIAIDQLSDARLAHLYRPDHGLPSEPWAALRQTTSNNPVHGY